LVWDSASGSSDTVAVVSRAFRSVVEGRVVYPPIDLGRFTAAADSRWAYARADLAEVTWRGMDGRVLQIARWPEEPMPLDLELGRDRIDEQVEGIESGPEGGAEVAKRFRRRMEEQFECGDVVAPLFQSLHAEANGTVWVDEYSVDVDGPRTFRLIGPDGVFLGHVQAPPRFHLLDVRDGLVLGIEKDKLDMQGVSVYRIP
jgi:hypothetical protein